MIRLLFSSCSKIIVLVPTDMGSWDLCRVTGVASVIVEPLNRGPLSEVPTGEGGEGGGGGGEMFQNFKVYL